MRFPDYAHTALYIKKLQLQIVQSNLHDHQLTEAVTVALILSFDAEDA